MVDANWQRGQHVEALKIIINNNWQLGQHVEALVY